MNTINDVDNLDIKSDEIWDLIDALESESDIKDELEIRKKAWSPLTLKYKWGALAKYACLVSSASDGAVCIPNIS